MPVHQDRLKRCAEYVRAGAGARYIDVGCGLGHSTDIMRRFVPGDWTGLEFWPEAKAMAIKAFPDIDVCVSLDFNLRPVCGTFDGVVCSEVLEHVPDDVALVKGLLDITAGTLCLTTPNRKVNDPGHLRVYTRAMLEALFPEAEIHSIGRFFYVIVKRQARQGDL